MMNSATARAFRPGACTMGMPNRVSGLQVDVHRPAAPARDGAQPLACCQHLLGHRRGVHDHEIRVPDRLDQEIERAMEFVHPAAAAPSRDSTYRSLWPRRARQGEVQHNRLHGDSLEFQRCAQLGQRTLHAGLQNLHFHVEIALNEDFHRDLPSLELLTLTSQYTL